jgi:hypothetical protein
MFCSKIINVFSSSAIDRGFEPRSDQTNNYNIGALLLLHKEIRGKDWLVGNQDIVSEWSDMSTR